MPGLRLTLLGRRVSFAVMFTIIGGDGKEYGPVTVDQVRAWIAGGRANLDTKARAVGSEEWRRLGDYAEFSFGGPPPIAPGSASGEITGVTEPALADRGRRLGGRLIDWAIEFACAIPGALILGEEFLRMVVMASRGSSPTSNRWTFNGSDSVRWCLAGRGSRC